MKITFLEASNKYGSTQRRKDLLRDLEQLLDLVCSQFSKKRVLLFGSFITDKPEPSDLDVMLAIETVPGDSGFNKYRCKSDLPKGGLDIFALQFTTSFEPRGIGTAEEMVEEFNSLPAHQQKNIRCRGYVEILCEGGH